MMIDFEQAARLWLSSPFLGLLEMDGQQGVSCEKWLIMVYYDQPAPGMYSRTLSIFLRCESYAVLD